MTKYYGEDEKKLAEKKGYMPGFWHGKLAEKLSLSGQIKEADFRKLVEGIDPNSNDFLTISRKENRRIGYDVNFHVPKSVSIMHSIGGDERIQEAFERSMLSTMQQMEVEMKTRIRKDYQLEDRPTGNMLWGQFTHHTARPVGGLPDPHLHAHTFVFNATFDEVENTIKAGQFLDIKRSADLMESVFHSRLMAGVRSLGYGVRLKDKKYWEIEGVPQNLIGEFSRRTGQIKELANQLGVKNPKLKDKLGAMSREGKIEDLDMAELKEIWQAKVSPSQRKDLSLVVELGKYQKAFSKQEIMGKTVRDLFEQNSTIREKDLLKKALWFGRGEVDLGEVKNEISGLSVEGKKNSLEDSLFAGNLIKISLSHGKYFTTNEVLSQERELLDLMTTGKGQFKPFGYNENELSGLDLPNNSTNLSPEQKQAIRFVLNSRDSVTSVQGGAGTGKTRMMKTAIDLMEKDGKKVFTFAPSISASRGNLRQDGFENADTVARLLSYENLAKKVVGGVIWVNEAGLLSVPDLKKVLSLARSVGSRVVLSGDTRQHSPVGRGQGLKLLEESGKLGQTHLFDIKRQVDPEYRKAVDLISSGSFTDGFEVLDEMGVLLKSLQKIRKGLRRLLKNILNLVFTASLHWLLRLLTGKEWRLVNISDRS